jgi:hypothetical protein
MALTMFNEITVDLLVAYLDSCSKEDIEAMFHRKHPRYRALETMSGRMLDIGAGNGGLGQLLEWPTKLEGKSLVGCDLPESATLPPGYSGWISGGWKNIAQKENFGGVLAIHVIEHLNDWREMLELAVEVLEEGQSIYIEWPVVESTVWPSATSIWESFKNLNTTHSRKLLSTFNFYDDGTHSEHPPRMDDVLSSLSKLKIVEKDRVYLPGVARELTSKGLKEFSVSNVTMGVWAEFGFAQYILAQKRFTDLN